MLVTSILFILATTDTVSNGTTQYATNYSTGCTVAFIDHGTQYCTTGTTDDGTFGGLTPAFFTGRVG